MYTIGEVSKLFNLPISTLRYYDKQGLFPKLKRENGIRSFSSQELETLRVIECLKKSGLSIKEIKQFMQWCTEGSSTYPIRHEFFLQQKESVIKEIAELQQTLDLILYKCWYYERAIETGSETFVQKLLPDKLPENIQQLYNKAHQSFKTNE